MKLGIGVKKKNSAENTENTENTENFFYRTPVCVQERNILCVFCVLCGLPFSSL
jgi:hypothetical protein